MSNLLKIETHQNTLAAQEQVGQYLTFLVEKENFAVSILDVKELIEITNITHVPLTPDYIYGVINVRGNVVPVIDMSARLKHHHAEVGKRSCIVLVEVSAQEGSHLMGMLVNEVRQILDIPFANIQPAPDFGSNIRTDFIQAMARVDEVFIILLAINRVLNLEELSQLNSLARSLENHAA